MQQINKRQRCELDAKDLIGPDTWKEWKADYDSLMSFRKSLKGKPSPEDLVQLKLNSVFIEFYDRVLWHSPIQASRDECVCAGCDKKRQQTAKDRASVQAP
jgi:hypothetical protein